MSTKHAVLAAGAVGVAVALAAAQPTTSAPTRPAPPQRCTPVPVSSMDPHPELAPWRCMPEGAVGPGPISETGGDPRRRYGTGEPPAPPPAPSRRPPRPDDLEELAAWKAEAYLVYLDAQDRDDPIRTERARADYRLASALLDEARRAALQQR